MEGKLPLERVTGSYESGPWIGGRLNSRVRISPGSYAGLINRVNLRPLPEVPDHWSVVEKFIRNSRSGLTNAPCDPGLLLDAVQLQLCFGSPPMRHRITQQRSGAAGMSVRAGALRRIRS